MVCVCVCVSVCGKWLVSVIGRESFYSPINWCRRFMAGWLFQTCEEIMLFSRSACKKLCKACVFKNTRSLNKSWTNKCVWTASILHRSVCQQTCNIYWTHVYNRFMVFIWAGGFPSWKWVFISSSYGEKSFREMSRHDTHSLGQQGKRNPFLCCVCLCAQLWPSFVSWSQMWRKIVGQKMPARKRLVLWLLWRQRLVKVANYDHHGRVRILKLREDTRKLTSSFVSRRDSPKESISRKLIWKIDREICY